MGAVESSLGCGDVCATSRDQYSKSFVNAREELSRRRTTRFAKTELEENY